MSESKTFSEREKLIELLQNVPTDFEGNRNVGTIADYLLKNGVIVPPVKCGDTIYEIISPEDKNPYLISAVVCAVHIANGSRNSCNHKRESYILAECPTTKYVNKRLLRKFGKTVFTSRKAAEKELAERTGHNE